MRSGSDYTNTIKHGDPKVVKRLLGKGKHYIISGQPESKRSEIEQDLKKRGIKYTALILKSSDISISTADWKAQLIKGLKLKLYCDNSPVNIDAINKAYPKCTTLLIN